MNQIFKFICCGSVDDGKSTLIGRLLADTGNIKKDLCEDAKRASLKNGSKSFEYSMLLDGLISEREQQITIDIANKYFDYNNIRFHIEDCPGHIQYIRNMAIAAAVADTAVLVIDVTKGIREQTKNHLRICSMFKIKNICICLTKCDLIFDNDDIPEQTRINALKEDIKELLSSYNFDYEVIPVSAVTGYNIDKVLQQLCLYANKTLNEKNKNNKSIIHIKTSKMYQGERYCYGLEVIGEEPKEGAKYSLLPANIDITISSNPMHGCFTVKENIDISEGDCISDCPVIISDFIKHQTVMFSEPTSDMLLKHGSRVVKVVNFTDNAIKLDNELIFNNIEDVKQNGFGILIDNITKKTIGCIVFTGNEYNHKSEKNLPGIYVVLEKNNKTETDKLIQNLFQSFNSKPVIIEFDELKEKIFKNQQFAYTSAIEFARILKKQDFNIIIRTKSEKLTDICENDFNDIIVLK